VDINIFKTSGTNLYQTKRFRKLSFAVRTTMFLGLVEDALFSVVFKAIVAAYDHQVPSVDYLNAVIG
jgi:hypothetical protein